MRRLVLLALPMVCACSGPERTDPRWEADLYYTHRLHIDGQRQLAAKRFAVLRERAKRPRDADEAGLMRCEALRSDGAGESAAACFDALATDGIAADTRTRALLHAAQIRAELLEDPAAALLLFPALIRNAPASAAAQRALDGLSTRGRQGPHQMRQIVALLLQLERENPRSPLADNLLLRAAMLLDEFGTPQAHRRAIGLLERMERHHRHSSALLPGLMLRAKLHRGFDEPIPESVALRAVVRTYETSHVFGTYVEPVHVRAMERLVVLLAGKLRDPARADEMLSRLLKIAANSAATYRYLAVRATLRERAGDLAGALAAWRTVLSQADAAQRDMRRNDRRICGDMAKADRRATCLRAVNAYGPLPIKEVPRARASIARLEQQIAANRGRR